MRLNRRYAPDAYIGVRAIVPGDGGLVLGNADDPRAIEYAVEMRRFDEGQTLERLVRAGHADEQLIERLAHRVADVHAYAAIAPPEAGSAEQVLAPVERNFEELEQYAGPILDPAVFAAVRHYAEAFGRASREFMAVRVAEGRIRECHGDLRAEHIVGDDGLAILDCVEFDDRLRHIDVASDLAFLAMDLERLGAPKLAEVLVDAYIEASCDGAVRKLLPFYGCYRAAVRAKVACARLEQFPSDAPRRTELAREAQSLLDLALRLAWRSRLPLALVFCGIAGSGKSTLALEIAKRSGLRHVSSDVVRKRLAGLAVDERGGAELYSDQHTARTYAELTRESAEIVRAEGGVIVDATFHRRLQRRFLREAIGTNGARVLFCECRALEPTLRRRSQARERAPEFGSDAGWDVIVGQRSAFEPLDEVADVDHLVIDTSWATADALAQLETLINDSVDRVPLEERSGSKAAEGA